MSDKRTYPFRDRDSSQGERGAFVEKPVVVPLSEYARERRSDPGIDDALLVALDARKLERVQDWSQLLNEFPMDPAEVEPMSETDGYIEARGQRAKTDKRAPVTTLKTEMQTVQQSAIALQQLAADRLREAFAVEEARKKKLEEDLEAEKKASADKVRDAVKCADERHRAKRRRIVQKGKTIVERQSKASAAAIEEERTAAKIALIKAVETARSEARSEAKSEVWTTVAILIAIIVAVVGAYFYVAPFIAEL